MEATGFFASFHVQCRFLALFNKNSPPTPSLPPLFALATPPHHLPPRCLPLLHVFPSSPSPSISEPLPPRCILLVLARCSPLFSIFNPCLLMSLRLNCRSYRLLASRAIATHRRACLCVAAHPPMCCLPPTDVFAPTRPNPTPTMISTVPMH